MALLACAMHWEISMLFTVPVLAVGGWVWWSNKRFARRSDRETKAPGAHSNTRAPLAGSE
jgi:hypothetical protein